MQTKVVYPETLMDVVHMVLLHVVLFYLIQNFATVIRSASELVIVVRT